jgi:hypothetical protein
MLVLPEKQHARVEAILDCELKTITAEGDWRVVIPLRKTGR